VAEIYKAALDQGLTDEQSLKSFLKLYNVPSIIAQRFVPEGKVSIFRGTFTWKGEGKGKLAKTAAAPETPEFEVEGELPDDSEDHKKALMKNNKPDVVAIAEQKGIDTAGKSKEEIVDAIIDVEYESEEPAEEEAEESPDEESSE